MGKNQNEIKVEEFIFKDVSQAERIQLLQNNAERREEFSYSRPYTSAELENMKDDFAQKSIRLSEINDELEGIKEQFKSVMKPIKEETSKLLSGIKLKTAVVTESVFLLANQEDGTMEYRNEQGYLVHFRKLLPEERQLKLQIKQTGTE